MKTIKRTVLVVVFMLGTLVNYANKSDFNNELNAKTIKIVFKETKKGEQLRVKDHNGVVLYSENVKSEGKLTKVFNFNELNDGNYTLELEKQFQIVVKSLKIVNNKVIFNAAAEKVIFKPVVRNKNNRLLISKINFDEKPLQVALYFNDEIIYSETLEGDAIVNRVYKLDEKLKGDYKVVIKNNDRSYINNFKI
jgi:hypothetical protein